MFRLRQFIIVILLPYTSVAQGVSDTVLLEGREGYYDNYLLIKDTMTANTWMNYRLLIENLESILVLDNQIINNSPETNQQLEMLERMNIELTNELLDAEKENRQLLGQYEGIKHKLRSFWIFLMIGMLVLALVIYIFYKRYLSGDYTSKQYRILEYEMDEFKRDAEKSRELLQEVKTANDMLHEDLEKYRARYFNEYDKVARLEQELELEKKERTIIEGELKRLLQELDNY